MNSATELNPATSSLPREDGAIDANKTAKFLANLQRTVGGRRDPDDVAVAPVAAKSQAAPVVEREIPVTRSVVARSDRPTKRKTDRINVEVTLDPGTASRVVYIRVDKTLADRLALIAFQNKISGTDGPSTVNDIGISALNRWLDEYETAS